MKTNISGIVITKNEEDNLEKCLKSLDFCDEIIVIDDYSIDKTLEIAKKFNAKIYKNKLENNFSKQRNFAMSKANFDWVLFLDADEIIPEDLKNEILRAVKSLDYNGYYLKRIDFIWNSKISHGEVLDLKLLRLAKKNNALWIGLVHERMKIDGRVGELKNSIFHYPHPTISDFLSKINFYSTLRARELNEKHVKTNVFQIIFYPIGKFIHNFFIKQGFLDGEAGLVFAIMMSFHSFLARGKLWQLSEK